MNHEFLFKMSGLFIAVLGEVARSVFTMKSVPFLSATKENNGVQNFLKCRNNESKCAFFIAYVQIQKPSKIKGYMILKLVSTVADKKRQPYFGYYQPRT